MPRRLLTLTRLALTLASLSGCDDLFSVGCVTGSEQTHTVCSSAVNGTVTASGASSGDGSLLVLDANCHGACSSGFDLAFFSQDEELSCQVDATPSASRLSAQTFALPSGQIEVTCNDGSSGTLFDLVTGTFMIDSVDDDGVRASFSLELRRPSDGAIIQIANGSLSVGQCHDVEMCSF